MKVGNRVAFALCMVWACLLGLGCSKPPDELHDEAVVAFKRGDLEKAERKLQLAVRKNPEYVEAYLQLAQIYEKQTKSPDAIAMYEKVLTLRPTQSFAMLRLANLYFEQDEFDKALSQLKPLSETDAVYDPKDKAQALRLRKIIEDCKMAKGKLTELEQRVSTDPSCKTELADSYLDYGKALVQRENRNAGEEYLKKGSSLRQELITAEEAKLEAQPKNSELRSNLAELYYKEGEGFLLCKDLPLAVQNLRKAVSYGDSVAKYHFVLAQLGDKEHSLSRPEVIALVEKAVKLEPENPVFRFALAGFYRGDKRLADSKAQMERLLSQKLEPAMKSQVESHLAKVKEEIANSTPK